MFLCTMSCSFVLVMFRFSDAVEDFKKAHAKMRSNVIDFTQLGCRYKFFAFEVHVYLLSYLKYLLYQLRNKMTRGFFVSAAIQLRYSLFKAKRSTERPWFPHSSTQGQGWAETRDHYASHCSSWRKWKMTSRFSECDCAWRHWPRYRLRSVDRSLYWHPPSLCWRHI